MIESRRDQIVVASLLSILVVGATLSVVYFSNQSQSIDNPTESNTHTTYQIPMDFSLNLVSEIDTGGAALHVHIENDVAYVIDTGQTETLGLIMVDVSNPSQPEILGSYHDGGLPFALEVAGDIVYIADQMRGLRIIDVSDPSSPTEIEGYTGSGVAYDLEIVGDLLFMADHTEGLVILNISTQRNPVFVSSYGSGCVHLSIEGTTAYIVSHEYLRLVDISNPNNPTYINQFSESGHVIWDPSVSNGIVYYANHGGDFELRILNASDSSNIVQLNEFDSGGSFQSFWILGAVLFAVDFENGLYALDVRNPASLTEIDLFSEPNRPWDVTLNGEYVYLCGSEGLQIIQIVRV